MNKNLMFTLCKKQKVNTHGILQPSAQCNYKEFYHRKKALIVLYIWRGFFYFSLQEIKH